MVDIYSAYINYNRDGICLMKNIKKNHYVQKLIKTLWASDKKKAKHKVININNYERYWEDSTPTGHQIRIACQDGSTLHLNLNWPKGYNPRNQNVDAKRWRIHNENQSR
tara:strand:+ start:926 stop:1252 length:327 start_codon:yes stop_codon:yes gene_type:complete